ncbi:MAG TPA: hypothetical protein VF857_09160, partial [Spirochaetota bacterium]
MATKKGPALKKGVKKSVKKSPVRKSGPARATTTVTKKVAAPAVDLTAPGMTRMSCEVIEMGGNSFVVVVNRARNFFTLEEMRSLVRICHEAPSESSGMLGMYHWLKGERNDVLIDTDIHSAND